MSLTPTSASCPHTATQNLTVQKVFNFVCNYMATPHFPNNELQKECYLITLSVGKNTGG